MSRILFVTPYYTPFVGGTTTFLEVMTRRLAANSRPAMVLTTTARCAADFWQPPTEPLLLPTEIHDGVEVERLAFSYPQPIPCAFGLLRRAGHWLHRSGLPATAQRPLLRRLARAMPSLPDLEAALARLVPTADLIQATDSSWDGLFTAAAEAAERQHKPFVACPLMHLGGAAVRAHFQMVHQVDAYRGADAVLALSQREAVEYVRLGVPKARIHVISMGVDPHQEHGDPAQTAAFRQQHDFQGPVVAFLGANTCDKGAFTLALAAAQLNMAGLPVHVVYAGSSSAGLLAFIARQDDTVRRLLEGRLHILGLVDETTKQQLLAACDLLALPSQVDTFGIVLLEAWLHAKPVIGALAGGIPDLVRDGQDGLLVPFGDVAALARAIERLAGDPVLAARLGAAGQERVLRDFTWDRTYRTLLGVYDAVMGNS